jgi:hypothetical protein
MCFAIRLDMHGLTRPSMLDGFSFPLGLLYRKGLPMLHQLLDSSAKGPLETSLFRSGLFPYREKKSAIYISLLNMVNTEIIAMDDTIIPFDFRTTKLWPFTMEPRCAIDDTCSVSYKDRTDFIVLEAGLFQALFRTSKRKNTRIGKPQELRWHAPIILWESKSHE